MKAEVLEALKHATSTLAREFNGIFSEETVRDFVQDSAEHYYHPEIASFVPKLAERHARELLQALAQSEGFLPKQYPELLFVCVQNAGRSQMAASFVNHWAEKRAHARCAGTQPARDLHAGVVEVMVEIGVPLHDAFPKPLQRELVEAANVVVTMGCGDACPLVPGRVYEDWALPDPAGMTLDQLRTVRDEVAARVRALLERLGVAADEPR